MRVIALEEHWGTTDFISDHSGFMDWPEVVIQKLCEVAEHRVAAMDEAGVDLQILSLAIPGIEQMKGPAAARMARDMNDVLASHIARHPDRFAGFAVLPWNDPTAAASELSHALDDLGFVGVVVNGHVGGRYLDRPEFSEILAAIAERAVPLYLHPVPSPAPIRQAWFSELSHSVQTMLQGPAWGWHVETGTHLLRLILGGAFDRTPALQIVIGHMGEMIPFMIPRLEEVLPTSVTDLAHTVNHYLRTNVSYTFAGFTWHPLFELLRSQVPLDRVLFSVDYPFADMSKSVRFLHELDVSDDERAAIACGNAERLLRLNGPAPR